MILDSQLMFSEAQAVTAVGDTPSTNVHDAGRTSTALGTASGAFDAMYPAGNVLVVRTVAGVTSGGSPTVQVVLQDSADNATFADVQPLTPALAPAALTANRPLAAVRVPLGLRRYRRLVYRVAGATVTAGSFTAMVAADVQAQQYLPSGFAVQ